MSVEKISFKGTEVAPKVSSPQKQVSVQNSTQAPDKEKSKAAKYMLGATILAGTIALGIIGHKNNWWRNVSEVADDLSTGGKNALESVENKASEVIDIDFSDFTKIQGEFYELGGTKYINKFNEDGKLIRCFSSKNGKTLYSISDYDPLTGKEIKYTSFKEDGKTLDFVVDYDPSTGKEIKQTSFKEDGKTLDFVVDYDPSTGKEIKWTSFQKDGKTLDFVVDYDPSTGKELKTTYYNHDGTVNRVKVAL